MPRYMIPPIAFHTLQQINIKLYYTMDKNVNKIFCQGSEAMGIIVATCPPRRIPVCLRNQAGPFYTTILFVRAKKLW